MKKIPLLPFFDLYAGTWNQQGLLTQIRTVYDEDKAIHVINALGKHMLSVGTPSGLDLGTDCVLERLRSNNYDVDLIVHYDPRVDGELARREHGYHACWGGDSYQIAFKHRDPPIDGTVFEKYYNPAPNINDYTTVIKIGDLQEAPAVTIARLSARLDAYEKAFGCEDMTVEEILNRHNNQPVSDDGTGNRSKAQFDEPDEPSLFVEGDDERLNPLWVLYTTNYHRGLLTKDQVENVGNNLLVQLQQCSSERLREMGPRGIPSVLTKFGHVSMAWVIYFKNTHQPNDLNFGQITRMGLTIAEQVKAYKPR